MWALLHLHMCRGVGQSRLMTTLSKKVAFDHLFGCVPSLYPFRWSYDPIISVPVLVTAPINAARQLVLSGAILGL